MRNPHFCICKNKDADQLCGNPAAHQCFCFRYIDGTIPLLLKSKISSLYPSSISVAVQPGLCQTWSETLKTGFLTMRLIYLYLLQTSGRRMSFSSGTIAYIPSLTDCRDII